MEHINHTVNSFVDSQGQITECRVAQVRASQGYAVRTYRKLLEVLAELAFENPELILLMRGQAADYPNREGLSTLYPTMYRDAIHLSESAHIYAHELKCRYDLLAEKELELYKIYRERYEKRVSRNRLLRWAILQHYEVCPTPLMDLTQSPRVAASFALSGNPSSTDWAYLYVLGLPQIHGSVTVVSEQALQIVRLASVCPPTTLRPYFQEGYLLGTYPSLDTLDEKQRYRRTEVDCATRLIAKLRLSKGPDFWGEEFGSLPESSLYPIEPNEVNDAILALRD